MDLAAAATHNVTVEEITDGNVVSVAGTGGNAYLGYGSKYIPAYKQVLDGKWGYRGNCCKQTRLGRQNCWFIGTGRIGQRVYTRLMGFDIRLP